MMLVQPSIVIPAQAGTQTFSPSSSSGPVWAPAFAGETVKA